MTVKGLTHLSVIFAALIAFLVFASPFLIPLAFAILIAFLLYTPTRWLEKKLPRILSASIIFFVTSILIVSIGVGFGYLFADVVSSLNSFDLSLENFVNTCCSWMEDVFGIKNERLVSTIEKNAAQLVKGPLTFLSSQLATGATFVFSSLITFVLAFLLVIYRTAFKNFFIIQLEKSKREEAENAVREVQKVAQKYLLGILLVMGILGILNSLGLWVIGVEYPLFWGFFAAILTIVPYVGTFIGGFMPFLFALLTLNTLWQPLLVVVLFLSVQFLEDNLIKPKVVGKQVDLNPFFAIIALLIGGVIWGVAGFVLALPYVAVLKIIFQHFNETQSIAELMGSDIYDKQDIFKKEYSEKKFSFFNIFKLRK